MKLAAEIARDLGKPIHYLMLYSGGWGSFLATDYLLNKVMKPEDSITLYFNDTKTESPELYKFLETTTKYFNLELVIDSDGRDIWDVFKDRKFIGNSRVDICSDVLKRSRAHKFIKQFSPVSTVVCTGFSWSEKDRLDRAMDHWKPYLLIAPLIEGWVDTDIYSKELIQRSGIQKPEHYELGFPHFNCGGFCVKAGLDQFSLLLEKLPEVYMYHEGREKELIEVYGLKPFLRKSVNGEILYLTMEQFRTEYLLTGKHVRRNDYGGCSCMI
jgi:3'-phosphoadenosine 5'-phosphosulfate sulfotransferase (PAPS reductase)/FAD synthetase